MTPLALAASWPDLWARVHAELKHEGYRRSTRRLYRHCLRRFARHAGLPPDQVRERHIRDYLFHQARDGGTSSWISANITVLRTVFDKLGGCAFTRHLTTPRRPWPLPHILPIETVRRILAAAPTLRDQLLLGLLYGCGLKAGEVSRLRWGDVQVLPGVPARGQLRLSETRVIPVPADLVPVLTEGLARCPASAPIFPGAHAGRPIADRTVALIVRQAVRNAGVEGPVDGMALRHSYAVHCLEAGLTIRELQLRLGHRRVTTTMIYLRSLHPRVASPLDGLTAAPLVPPATAPGASPAVTPVVPAAQPAANPDTRPPVPGGPPSLFPAPLTTEALVLPFTSGASGMADGAWAFYRRLRTRLAARFLALKRAIRSPV